MLRLPVAAALLCVAACQQQEATNRLAENAVPGPDAGTPKAPSPMAGATAIAVPASYDWVFATHGGSGDLVFGDGDTAEGVSLVTLSCLPGANAVTGLAAGAGGAALRSGQISVVISTGMQMAVGHPVLRDLQTTGTVTLVSGNEARVLAAKPGAGRIAVESFLAYCAAG